MFNKPIEEQVKELREENLRLKAENNLLKGKKTIGSRAKSWFKRAGTNAVVGKGLIRSIKQLYSELPGEVKKETVADVSGYLIMRLTRIGIFTFMIAIIPLFVLTLQTLILGVQNNKIDKQNDLIKSQNRRLDQQIHLEEGNRRSSFIFLMSNIMDKIDEELKDNRPGDRSLSNELIGRIVSLSQALRPYRYLEEDELIVRQLSPERGQFLYALINSYLSKDTYEKIFDGANFSYSDLKEANFTNAHLVGANLAHSYLPNANFQDANLGFVDFSNSDLAHSSFEDVYMSGANFHNANLSHTRMIGVKAESANLVGTNLSNAKISGDFSSINLDGVKLYGADLGFVNLDKSYFTDSIWLDTMTENIVKGIEDVRFSYTKEALIDTITIGKGDSAVAKISALYILKYNEGIIMEKEECENVVKHIIKSNSTVSRHAKKSKSAGDLQILIPVASLYGTENGRVSKDSVYVYQITTQNKQRLEPFMTVAFNPRSGILERVDPDGFRAEMFYDTDFYEDLEFNCKGINPADTITTIDSLNLNIPLDSLSTAELNE